MLPGEVIKILRGFGEEPNQYVRAIYGKLLLIPLKYLFSHLLCGVQYLSGFQPHVPHCEEKIPSRKK